MSGHSSGAVEHEQHFVFNSTAYNDIRKETLVFSSRPCVSDFLSTSEQNAVGGFLRECFSCRKSMIPI